MPSNPRANRYDHTPRKVFDKAIDRMDAKRRRDRQDNSNDLQIMIQKIKHLHQLILALTDLVDENTDHLQRHCAELDTSRNGNEELE